MAVQLISQKAMNTVVSHIDGVRLSVAQEASKIAGKGRSLHYRYHDGNDKHESKFGVTHGDVDSFANMDHPAAFYIEMGWISKKGTVVPGKHTMKRAAGLL